MTEQQIINYFSEKYGTDVFSRLKKLREEMNELIEAQFSLYLSISDEAEERLKDELSDVITVAIHTAHILGETSETMLNRAYNKAKIRETNPEYKHSKVK
jgi:NTP pyrophosphatase (non-canonical NTP hydrolase)